MASSLLAAVARARRRLVLGSLLKLTAWLWLAAAVLAVGWFLAEPLLLPEAPPWLRWAVLGGLIAVASLLGLVLAVRAGPSAVAAGMTIDERFNLKERVVTSLTLSPEQADSPAGRMVTADAESRLAGVRVGDRFPLVLPWQPLALLSGPALALVLLTLFWEPRSDAQAAAEPKPEQALAPEAKAALDQQMQKLVARKPRDKAKPEPDAKELERIEAEIDKFARRARDKHDDVRDRIKDATEIEAEIKKQQQKEAARIDALREQAKQEERLRKKKRDDKPQGPAGAAADAVAQADFERARDELNRLSRKLEKEEQKERLRRKMKDPKASDEDKEKARRELDKLDREQNMTQKEREELEKQLKEMEEQLKRLSRSQDEKQKELDDKKKEADKKKDDAEQKKKEAEQKKKEAEKKQKELEDKEKRGDGDKDELAKQKKDAQQQGQQAAQEEKDAEQQRQQAEQERGELDRESEQLKKDGEQISKQDLADLKKAAEQLGEAKKAMEEGKDGEAAKKLAEAGQQMDKLGRDGQQKALAQKLAQMQQARQALARTLSKDGGIGAGRRPLAKDDGGTGADEHTAKGQWDKGKVQGAGFGPMGGHKGPLKPSALKEEIRQNAQEQAAAVDRQRLPASRRNLAKGYFEQPRDEKKKP